MIRKAQAVWEGDSKGSGNLSVQSGALSEQPYSMKLRFENEDGKKGTNPEELIAAAHAGCFAMALSVELEKAGHKAETLNVNAELSLNKGDGGWSIDKIDLKLKAIVTDISEDEFDRIANGAKENCPVSKLLDTDIELHYTLN